MNILECLTQPKDVSYDLNRSFEESTLRKAFSETGV